MRRLAFLLLGIITLSACSHDPYETGDSSLSYLRADMTIMHVVGKSVKSAVTDDDEQLLLADDACVPSSLERNDTTYRMMLYYNKVSSTDPVKFITMQTVSVLNPIDSEKVKTMHTDPVTLVSAWKSANGSFVNMEIGVKTGNADDSTLRQSVAMVCDSVVADSNGSSRRYYTFFHNQNDIPEYYTQSVYVSMPISDCKEGDELFVNVNTYDGLVSRTFNISKSK